MPQDDRPHVLMMSEITVDGKLTLKRGASSKILMKYMAPETEVLLHRTRAECDAIMVGANTIRIDNSFLTVRLVEGKNPLRVIPTSRGEIPPGANILWSGCSNTYRRQWAALPENTLVPGCRCRCRRRRHESGRPPATDADPEARLRC